MAIDVRDILNNDIGAGAGSLSGPNSYAGTTTSIANNAIANLNITAPKGYIVYKIQTSAAAWIRLYTTAAARTGDASRTETEDPVNTAGVIAEILTTGASTVAFAPAVYGYNDESTPVSVIPVAVKNKSGSSAAITVTITAVQVIA
jgi:hypothetical protein